VSLLRFPRTIARRATRARVGAEDGLTLIELLVAAAILVIVVTAITDMLVSGINSQSDQTNRVASQQDARVALDRMRREIHSGCSASPGASPLDPNLTLNVTLPSGGSCSPGTQISWCATGSGPYALTRYSASNCAGTGSVFIPTLLQDPSKPVFTVASPGTGSTTLGGKKPITLGGAAINIPLATGQTVFTTNPPPPITIGTSPTPVSCTQVSGATLFNCTGGSGTYSPGVFVLASGQELTKVDVNLLIQTKVKPYRQFRLADSIYLRNSRQ
jgi:prepilin-type N-terminal cleavage/methylation domain-containing protein